MELFEHGSRRDQVVVESAMLEQIRAFPAAQEGSDQDVRVEKDSHEMRSKTSSSVKIFWDVAIEAIRLRRDRKRRMKRKSRRDSRMTSLRETPSSFTMRSISCFISFGRLMVMVCLNGHLQRAKLTRARWSRRL